jgi:hypothetical protein
MESRGNNVGMRTVGLIFCMAAAALAAATAANAERRATLLITDTSPIRLVGAGFVPRELVRVTVVTPEVHRSARIRATRSGHFTVSFAAVAPDRCNSAIRATAFGDKGSRAAAKVPQLQCPPRLREPG